MPHPTQRIEVHRTGDLRGTLNIRDSGDEAHLWFEQRVPWPVALEILKELAHDATSRPRGPCRAPGATRSSVTATMIAVGSQRRAVPTM
jgi:hypothetical protein